jgi:hypothetical protein
MTRTNTIYPILKAELVRPRGGLARFWAHPDKADMLVVIRRRHGIRPAWQWRHVMSPGQARELYRRLVRDGWQKTPVDR